MTSRARFTSGTPGIRHVSSLALATLLVAAATLPGCAFGLLGRRNEPVTRAQDPQREEPQRSKLDRQLDDVREQATLDPKQPYWSYRIAQIYLDTDSLASAEASLKASLARDPDYGPALSLLSKLYYEAGRHEEAVTLLEAARVHAGGSLPPDLLAGLALHYDALGRLDLAAGTATAAARGEDADARSALVYVTLRGNHPETAAAPATAAVDDDPRSAANQNNYGITRLRAGDPAAARIAFLKAIELDPKLPGPYYNLAILEKFYLFDDEHAARWFKAYRDRDQSDPDSLAQAFAKSDAHATAGKEK
jgi:tetratricopeptide (TPR) repeat protein